MELAGNEKKILALFHELKFADEGAAPEFIKVWNRARVSGSGSLRGFRLSFALAVAVVVITLGSLALWSRNWQRIQATSEVAHVSQKPGSTFAPQSVTPAAAQFVMAEPRRIKSNRGVRKPATRQRPDTNTRTASAVISETVAISSWQSPTAILLQSPADDVLMPRPQLDLSVHDLKTFLPNSLQ